MPGPPYEYISGLILRSMEDHRFAGLRGRRVVRRRRRRRRRRSGAER